MTFKEIWVNFCDKTKEQAIQAWEGMKQVSKSSFEILKDTFISFFTGIYEWLVEFITGAGKVLLALVNFIFLAIGTAIFTTLKLCLDKLVDWIIKW